MNLVYTLYNYFSLNPLFFFLGWLYYNIDLYLNIYCLLLNCLIKNCFLLYILNNHTKKHCLLGSNKLKISFSEYIFNIQNIIELITSAIIEVFTIYFCKYWTFSNIIIELIIFIPHSFIFEIVFDFFHYWTHRILHTRRLYFIHSTHHQHTHQLTVFSTFHHNPIDLLFTNILPVIFSSYIIPLTKLQFFIWLYYKTFIEISGHSGCNCQACSFKQLPNLAKYFNIELYTSEHYIHHTRKIYNYSKRFKLWDRLFSTYTNKYN